jgi:hypothetical protein
MSAGQRRVLLSAAFFGLALLLTATTARAQDRTIWQSKLTPDQLKAALSRLGGGSENLDPFRDQILDMVKKQQPNFNEDEIKKALEILKKHPELLEQAKKFAKDRQLDPGRPGRLTPDDLGKLFKIRPGDQLPDPKDFQPPQFDPPMFRPPGMGNPPPPPGMGDPPGKVDPPMPGKVDPPRPPVNPPGKNKITLDENPFPATPENTDPRAKSLDALTAIWENNLGPLSETPEVKKALLDLLDNNDLDFDFRDENGNSLWDFLKDGGNGMDFGDFFNNSGGGGSGWGLGDWDFPKFGNWWGNGGSSSSSSSWWNSNSSSRPSSSGWGSSGGGGGFDFGGVPWLPFVILLVLILAVVIWFQIKNLQGREAAAAVVGDGLGPWPIDPRQINTREDVVKAFEYLSVLICGPSAKTWTHSTIADALSDLAATHGETAVMLARLYELARYAPLDEPLTRDELVEARKLVCGLAGVSY